MLIAYSLVWAKSDIEHTPITILASGNNKFVLPAFIKSFQKKYPGSKVVVEYGASGDLANSILNGVLYDVFLSANMSYPQDIYKAGKAAYPPKEYARGSLILFIPADSTFSQKKLKVLKNKKIKHITIANKETAPYGVASIDALRNTKLLESLKDKNGSQKLDTQNYINFLHSQEGRAIYKKYGYK